jgi:hypothetical protein
MSGARPYKGPLRRPPSSIKLSHHWSPSMRLPAYQAEASYAKLLLGGVPASTAAYGVIIGARAWLEVAHTIAQSWPNRAAITSSPPFVSVVVIEQNGFLSSPRSCRKKPHHIWSSIPRVWALPCTGHGASPSLFMLVSSGEEDANRSSVDGSTVTIRRPKNGRCESILADDRDFNGQRFMNFVDSWTASLWTQSMGPWTYSTHFP